MRLDLTVLMKATFTEHSSPPQQSRLFQAGQKAFVLDLLHSSHRTPVPLGQNSPSGGPVSMFVLRQQTMEKSLGPVMEDPCVHLLKSLNIPCFNVEIENELIQRLTNGRKDTWLGL